MRNITIRTRLMLMLLFVSLLACIALGLIGSNFGKKIISEEVTNQLKVERLAKQHQIEEYVQDIGQFVKVMGQNNTIIQAAKDFKEAYYGLENEELNTECSKALADHYEKFMGELGQNIELKKDIDLYYPMSLQGCYLQFEYIVENPNPPGEKHKYLDAEDGSEYSKVHQKYHPYFNMILETFSFYDMFLVDLNTGDILYSTFKETDFATNLYAGPYRNSNLAELVQKIKRNDDLLTATWMDFAAYRPSYGAPAGFVGVPLTDDGQTIGALVFQFPVDKFNQIMTDKQDWKANGMGDSGETYLVGEDKYMRSISRFFIEDSTAFSHALLASGTDQKEIDRMYRFGTTILQQRVNSEAVEEAIKGNSGTKIIRDYRNEKVISSFAPLNLADLNWTIMAEIDEAEAFRPIAEFNKRMLITTIILVIIVSLLALLLSSRFVRPLQKLSLASHKIMDGDTSYRVDIKSRDEFGTFGKAFNEMVGELDKQKIHLKESSEYAENLLLNFIPKDFMERLHNGEKGFAEEFHNVSLVAVDIVGFCELSKHLGASVSAKILNEITTALDSAAQRNFVERIKTVGDIYFAACGLFDPRLDHSKRMFQFAREIRQIIDQVNLNHNTSLKLHICLHNGDVIAGIVGEERYSYDVWGPSVSAVFEMVHYDVDEQIVASQTLVDRIQDLYTFEKLENTVGGDIALYKFIEK